nr:zinc finger, CCHC-type [Tanacetum cinerariifolium]
MGDANPIRTLGDYSKPSNEGYKNTIELPEGNNAVPLRSDTIRLVQNRCSFHALRSEDPNQHLKDFIKLVDPLDLNGRTVKLRNDILMFQQHQGESLSEAWTRFKNLLQKFPHHSIDRWLLIQFFYDHVSFHLKCEIDRAAGGKLHDKNTKESWEIIENLTLYNHERWNDSKDFVKPVKAISTPQSTLKTPDRILLELEDHINFLLKGSRLTPRPSSTQAPQPYAEAVYSNPRPQKRNEPPKQNPFTFCERTGPNHQPLVLETTFEARVWDYMAAHAKRIERFKNTIFKQREVINDRMTEMFGLLKELLASRNPEKVLIREEARHPITKNLNSISIIREEKEKDLVNNRAIIKSIVEPSKSKEEEPLKKAFVTNEVERRVDDEPTKSVRENVMKNEEEEAVGASNFVILDIKEDEKRPFILRTPFMTTAKAMIKFDKGIITLRSGKSKISFHRIPECLCKVNKGIKNDIEPISPTMTVNRLVLEWEEKKKLHQAKEIKFDQWRSKNFINKHPALVEVKIKWMLKEKLHNNV